MAVETDTKPATPLEAARDYVRRGWSVVPVPYKQKRPVLKEWEQLRLTVSSLDQYFDQPANIGLILGEPSGWLVDVDLDCSEARAIAANYLPPTQAKSGRSGAPESHWWYIAEGAKTAQHRDPVTRQMIVELRSTGGQTVVGPSIHPTGQQYDILTGEPAVVPAAMLTACVEALAKQVITLRHGDQPAEPVCNPSVPTVDRHRANSQSDVERRALAYLDKLPPAISGNGGHAATYTAATVLVHGFEIDPERAFEMLVQHYNPRCEPPWSEKELQHKVTSAATKPHDQPRGWLLNVVMPEVVETGVNISALVGQADDECRSDARRTKRIELPTNVDANPAVKATAKPKSVRQMLYQYPELREPVIHGLLRVGETMNVIASPKVGKSWLVTDLAMAVATGRKWLDTFETEPGLVLIIDNELHHETSANRIPKVMRARGIQLDAIADRVFVENVRGGLQDIFGLGSYFESLTPGRFKLIVLDAFYRFMPKDTDENDNGTMSQVYNHLDRYAAKLGCSFVLVHHSSKGNQSGKSVTDVGAGAGSQSRATDTHLVLRPHEEQDCVVLDAAVRSWPPIEPRALRWSFPVWTPDDGLDPTALRSERPRRRTKANVETEEATKPQEPTWDALRFATAFVGVMPAAKSSIIQTATNAGLSERKANSFLRQAEAEGLIHRWRFGPNYPVQYATNPQLETTP